MQTSEIRFSRKIKNVTMIDKHCNTAIRELLDIESLLLLIERLQLRWFGHGSRMPREQLLKQTLYAEVIGNKISRILVGTTWNFIQVKCSLCWWIEKCGNLIWSFCPRNPLGKAGEKKRKYNKTTDLRDWRWICIQI